MLVVTLMGTGNPVDVVPSLDRPVTLDALGLNGALGPNDFRTLGNADVRRPRCVRRTAGALLVLRCWWHLQVSIRFFQNVQMFWKLCVNLGFSTEKQSACG